jgi:hypothetical protein
LKDSSEARASRSSDSVNAGSAIFGDLSIYFLD